MKGNRKAWGFGRCSSGPSTWANWWSRSNSDWRGPLLEVRGLRGLVAQLPPFEVAALRSFRIGRPQDLKGESCATCYLLVAAVSLVFFPGVPPGMEISSAVTGPKQTSG